MHILNLTQHVATHEQLLNGVFEPSKTDKVTIKSLLTFDLFTDTTEVEVRAEALAEIAKRYGVGRCMIGGAPFMMGSLERALKLKLISPVYAFTERVFVESVSSDGILTKDCVFKHAGFVYA